MPKKHSSWGEQEYIPAGNGDASGEYADEGGSNAHFTSFKKPEEKKPTRTNELSNYEKSTIQNMIGLKKARNAEINYNEIKDRLKYLFENSLSGFSDEEIIDAIKEIENNSKFSNEMVYFKDGNKWKMTNNIGMLEENNIKYYTKEEKEREEQEKNKKLVEKSQNDVDKKMQSKLKEGAIVCFGKGYKKEDLDQIEKDLDTYTKEFPELKDTIKMMGDRNNLEKYVNAAKANTQPTEEEIAAEMKRYKKLSFISMTESQLRAKAIASLQAPTQFTKRNDAYAYWDPSHNALIYMAKMKNVTNETKQQEYRENFKSSDKGNATFCHELGHAIDTAMKKKYDSIIEQATKEREASNGEHEKFQAAQNKIFQAIRINEEFITKLQEYKEENYNKEYDSIVEKRYQEKYNEPMRYTFFNNEQVTERAKEIKNEMFEEGIKKYNISQYGATNIKEFTAECFSAHYTGMKNPLADKVVELYKDYQKKLGEI